MFYWPDFDFFSHWCLRRILVSWHEYEIHVIDTNPERRIKNEERPSRRSRRRRRRRRIKNIWRRDNPADGWMKWKSNDFRLHAQGIVRIASIVLFNPPTRSPTSTISSILNFIIFIMYIYRLVLLLPFVRSSLCCLSAFGCRCSHLRKKKQNVIISRN